MPRYSADVSFTLTTEIEPEGIRFDYNTPDSVSEFNDNSYWQRTEVDSDGGNLTFEIEADSEEDAEALISEFLYEGQEMEDDSGFAWLVRDVSVQLDELEEPMTMEKAEAILIGLAEGQSDPKVKEAVEFVFDAIGSLDARLLEAMSRIDGLVERVRLAETTVTETVDPVAG